MSDVLGPRPTPPRDMRKVNFLAAVEEVRAARVRYATEFLRFRVKAPSDGYAHQQAIAETKDELTTLEAHLELARRELDRR